MSSQAVLYIIQMGAPPESLRSVYGDQWEWFQSALAKTPTSFPLDIRITRPDLDEPLPEPGSFDVAVISGSWCMVTDRLDWSERTAEWIRQVIVQHQPLLGVCYGHQLMAHALGGVVDYHPDGPEIGSISITLNPAGQADPFFTGFPQQFRAHLTHEQSVLQVPSGATVLGSSGHDPNQIIRYTKNALSVQFHPEFFEALMRHIIVGKKKLPPEQKAFLLDAVVDTAWSKKILQQFVGLFI
ncbi:glutamine amidotransferase [Advenella sp. WQ 585]|uniref:Glutamine amidotransferase n=1 Tax=Advenella mandrilli TaxID=2800330 RepID=A0ABS1EBY5_9BURK|nr:glutamine amidotransferase [Advenella mandrilli]MBK1780523.1 glutamine amidotransferase [Advenella mandrilli]